jgi:GTP-binding protein
VLFQSESLRFKKGSSVPVGASKEDQSPLAAAEKFFGEDCRILYSAESFYHHPHNDHIPEIVVLGASNAGKSSFLNALVGGMEVAKVSHKPGKTTTMNAYGVGPRPKIAKELVRKGDAPPKHSLILMDTPGYGFKSQEDWGKTILKYLNARKMLRGAIILIPADKKLQETDRWMLRTLARSNTRTLVVITKADKPGDGWQDACHNLHTQIQGIVSGLEAQSAASWREGSDRMLDVYATASKIAFISRQMGNGGGIGGVRLAILEMAGFSLGDRIEKQPETKAYTGQIVSFDDIVWKS